MNKEIEIPEGYEARIEGNKIILEPKESNDERIMEELLRWLKLKLSNPKVGFVYQEMKQWIAYLEKQKAKEKYDRLAPIYSDQQSFEDALEKAWKFYNDSGSRTVDGLEDNSIELSFAKGFREGFLCKEKQKEQKPVEWSEEDEKNLQGVIDEIEANKNTAPGYDIPTYDKFLTWLKSLRPQPKVELTELDKNILKAAIAFVEQNDHFNCWGGVDKHTVLSALRSLKPHWKPSEEQMKALKRFIGHNFRRFI